jgi:hypothetical protein
MAAEDKTLLLVEDDRPLRAERRPSEAQRSARPRDQENEASAA